MTFETQREVRNLKAEDEYFLDGRCVGIQSATEVMDIEWIVNGSDKPPQLRVLTLFL